MKNKLDLMTLYRNYLFALAERRQYGDIYGDTDEMINMYERLLEKGNIKKIKIKDNLNDKNE